MSSLGIFLTYAGLRFKRLNVASLHLLVTGGGLLGAVIGLAASSNTRVLGLGIVATAVANFVITIAHYVSSYYWFKKD